MGASRSARRLRRARATIETYRQRRPPPNRNPSTSRRRAKRRSLRVPANSCGPWIEHTHVPADKKRAVHHRRTHGLGVVEVRPYRAASFGPRCFTAHAKSRYGRSRHGAHRGRLLQGRGTLATSSPERSAETPATRGADASIEIRETADVRAVPLKQHQPAEPSALEISSTTGKAVIGSASGPPRHLGT